MARSLLSRRWPALTAALLGGLPGLYAQPGPPPPTPQETAGGLRVESVGRVVPNVLGVVIRAGAIEVGRQVPYQPDPADQVKRDGHQRWVSRQGRFVGSLVGRDEALLQTPDRFLGERLDAAWAEAPETYRIHLAGGPVLTPRHVWRKTKPVDLGRVGPVHPWQFDCATESSLFLDLPEPLAEGQACELRFAADRLAPVAFTADSTRLRSEAVHVSHLGFHPGDPAKVAFLSCWLGSGGPLAYPPEPAFRVVRRPTGETVLQGRARLSKAGNDTTEDAYKRNYSGTDVFEMDFSVLREPGEYVVVVDGIGCSYPFRIAASAWLDAFVLAARGFYHQRSGIALGPPCTTFRRPRPFHPDDGVTVLASTCGLMDSGNGLNYRGTDTGNFGNLVKGRTDATVPDAWGGYRDAGDWDRRIQHLVVARYLLELAELFPEPAAACALNLPESGNGLPDVVNEARFGLDCYRRLQAPDGGIRGGIESEEHPREGEGSWQESLTVLAYAPCIWSSHAYAATAARAARVLDRWRPELAATYRESALRAMEYAETHWPDLGEPKATEGGVVDTRNLAAAELYRLTGEARWQRIFLETTVFRSPSTELFHWPTHNQREPAWVYAVTPHAGVDAAVQANCRQAIRREADARLRAGEGTGFRWTKYEWQPPAWGAFTRPDGVSLARAHRLTGEGKYLRALVLACQHGTGANPLNLCYTTGLGPRWPRHPLHIDSRVTHQSPPPGLTVFGPVGYDQGKGEWGQKLADPHLFPPFAQWPTLEAYWDIFWYPPMCEFTVQSPMAEVAYVWGYLALCGRP